MRVTIRDVKVICCAPQKINLVTVKVETSEPGLYGVGLSLIHISLNGGHSGT